MERKITLEEAKVAHEMYMLMDRKNGLHINLMNAVNAAMDPLPKLCKHCDKEIILINTTWIHKELEPGNIKSFFCYNTKATPIEPG